MKTERTTEGYLLIDHRNSPGAGRVGAGVTFESATCSCSHCQRVVVLNPDRSRERARCRYCFKYVCDGCAAILAAGGACKPFAAVLEDEYDRIIGASRHG